MRTIDLRTMTTAVDQQEAITKDNVPIKINAVIWRKTIDPKRAVIEVVDVGDSVVQVAKRRCAISSASIRSTTC